MQEIKITKKGTKSIVDPELVSLFDLLAKFDFEDKQKEKKNNSNKNPAVGASGQLAPLKT